MKKFNEGDYVRVKKDPTQREKARCSWNHGNHGDGFNMNDTPGKVGRILNDINNDTYTLWIPSEERHWAFHACVLSVAKNWRVKKLKRKHDGF